MKREIFVKKNNREIRIHGDTIIIWGCGHYTRNICQRIAFDEADYLIDSDKSKHGKKFQLYLEEKYIYDPTILDELNPDTSFVLISNKYHAAEIANDLGRMFPTYANRCANIDSVFYKYNCIEEMIFNDRCVMERVCSSNILTCLSKYIRDMETVIREKLGLQSGEYMVWPAPYTTRVSFFIMDVDKNTYIGRMPYWDKWNASFYHRRYIEEIKRNLGIDQLTLYEDIYGISISKVAENIDDWDDKSVIEDVKTVINTIHECQITLEETADIPKYLRYEEFFEVVPNVDEELFEKIKGELRNYTPHLCHNDLHCGNILRYNNCAVLIDFEHMAMGDEVYDTSKLIMDLVFFRKSRLFDSIESAGEYFLCCSGQNNIEHLYACIITQMVKNIHVFALNGEDVTWQKKELEQIIEKYSGIVGKKGK